MLCAVLPGCYKPDQLKLEKEVRALVQPSITMTEAADRLRSHGFACASYGAQQDGKQPPIDCSRLRGLGCMEALTLEPAEWSPVVASLRNLRAVCTWF
jgi:hypothetical protein